MTVASPDLMVFSRARNTWFLLEVVPEALLEAEFVAPLLAALPVPDDALLSIALAELSMPDSDEAELSLIALSDIELPDIAPLEAELSDIALSDIALSDAELSLIALSDIALSDVELSLAAPSGDAVRSGRVEPLVSVVVDAVFALFALLLSRA